VRGIGAVAPARLGVAWQRLADQVITDVGSDCLHPSGRWQRAPADPRIDAALLLPAIHGAIPANDPRTVATLETVRSELAEQGFVYRFRPDERPLGEAKGAFLLCGFLMALAEHQQGNDLAAVRWFERNLTACGPSGVFAEEYDVGQHQLRGNLPQAFVHALLLETAHRLAGPSLPQRVHEATAAFHGGVGFNTPDKSSCRGGGLISQRVQPDSLLVAARTRSWWIAAANTGYPGSGSCRLLSDPEGVAVREVTEASAVAGVARHEADVYRGDNPRPLAGYLAVLGVYGVMVAVATVLAAVTGRKMPTRWRVQDLVTVTMGTHKLSRTLSKDAVTSPLRAPFTQYAGTGGPAEVNEEARQEGQLRHSLGELLTCPFCLDVWVATAFAMGLIFAPRFTRLVAGTFTVLAGADFLQLAYAIAQQSPQG
jgi:hypothetical protein